MPELVISSPMFDHHSDVPPPAAVSPPIMTNRIRAIMTQYSTAVVASSSAMNLLILFHMNLQSKEMPVGCSSMLKHGSRLRRVSQFWKETSCFATMNTLTSGIFGKTGGSDHAESNAT